MSFLDDFFAEPDTSKCQDCGGDEELMKQHTLYTTDAGKRAWICQDCKIKKDKESQERITNERARIQNWAARDAWEEG